MREPMFEVSQEAVIDRGSMEIEYTHLAELRVRAIRLDISPGALRRTDVEVEQGRVFVDAFHPDIRKIDHVVAELLRYRRIPRLQIEIGMRVARRQRHDIRDRRRNRRRG